MPNDEIQFNVSGQFQNQDHTTTEREQNPDGQNDEDSNVVNSQLTALYEAKAKRFNDDTDHRAGLVDWIKNLIPIYLTFVFYLLVANGIDTIQFHLSDEIILAILCTTTANIIGLAVIVLKGLFK